MAQKIEDLKTDLTQMPQEELEALVKKIRQNKYITKPALVAREKKQKKKQVSKLDAMLSKLSPEQIKALLDKQKGE